MHRRQFLKASLFAAAAVQGPRCSLAQSDDPQSLDDLLEPIRQEHSLPALAAVAIHEGKFAGLGAVGVRKLGDETPATSGDRFHLGSCTKTLTAALMARLIEQGQLDWSSPLADAFDNLAATMHEDYRPVTVEQLLQHRAGFSSETGTRDGSLWSLFTQKKLSGSLQAQRRQYAALVLREPPIHPPATKFAYSNRSYIVAGALLEKVTGTAWEDLLQREVLDPLEMATAGFGPMAKPGKVDQPWPHLPRDGKFTPVEPGPLGDNPLMLGPAGTAHCSPGDWGRFLRDQLRGGQGQAGLLKPETYARLHTPAEGGEYACGWATVQRDWAGGPALVHSGSNTMNYAVAWLAPKKDFGLGVMTNAGGDAALAACDQTAGKLIGRFLLGRD